MDWGIKLLIVLGLLTFLIVGTGIVLIEIGNQIFGGIVLGVMVGLVLLLIILITAYLTRRQTIATLREGANIVLNSQHINDTWDARKTQTLASVLKDGARLARTFPGNDLPALPLPSQSQDWLPSLQDMQGNFIEVDEDLD